MPKYVIEREIAGAGKLTPDQLKGISQKSCGVLKKLGPQIQWLESYVTDDKIYCVYIAPDEATVREQAKQVEQMRSAARSLTNDRSRVQITCPPTAPSSLDKTADRVWT